MSDPIATYSFLPWLRQGIANSITATSQARATVPVQLQLTGEGLNGSPLTELIPKNVQLYGPGDIVGIDRRAIVKTEPRHWITNFEPNYLPYIEFYDEDFPWRYTPAVPNGSRLLPWITLVILKDAREGEPAEFEDGKTIQGRPLPFIRVPNASVFPPADQLWAWAHVHINRSLTNGAIASNAMETVLPKFQAILQENPDLAYSRLLCPRRLEENTAYHAFVIPSFESGRLSGLGLPIPDTLGATVSAWGGGDRPEPEHYPYYHRWFFRTGTAGDFEYLVRLLQPKPVDPRVGTRDMDVLHPGSNLPGITKPELSGVLKLGGALKIPFASLQPADQAEVSKYENWAEPYPQAFQVALAALLNLADDYSVKSVTEAHTNPDVPLEPVANDPIDSDDEDENDEDENDEDENDTDSDPLIVPPIYGCWHGLTQRVLNDRTGNDLPNRTNWLHELNLDPRFRVSAGFGTKVVQERQEEYMEAAWEQVGEIVEANRRIRAAQLAKEVAWIWYDRHLQPLRRANVEKTLVLTAPMHRRVVTQGYTVYYQTQTSTLPTAALSIPMRRIVRPRGRFLRSLPFEGTIQPNNLLTRMNAGEVSAAPPKQTPPGVVTVNDAAAVLPTPEVPESIADLLRWLPSLLLLVFIVLLVWLVGATGTEFAIGSLIVAVVVFLYDFLRRLQQSSGIQEDNQTPASIEDIPRSPDFVITEPGSGVTPTRGTTDSVEAQRFKEGLKDAYTMLEASVNSAKQPFRTRLNLGNVATGTLQQINPELTIPRRMLQIVMLPPRLRSLLSEAFQEVMAYPEFDTPMYKPLADLSSELFLPNLNRIEQNSITLLETNQKFIEAYMVGLNHEFARELLWREYPTDQRGSYFRQFWDVSSFLSSQSTDPKVLKEKLRDIPPLHRWQQTSKLGDHDNREEGGDKEEEVVLVIRGELLKKYPTAVIYAHRAKWQLKSNGTIDNTRERLLVELNTSEVQNPPRTKIKTPLYSAKVDPDIYFFGFDLTVTEARGGTGANLKDDAGWFFVIKERPGEPRFGLDLDRAPTLHTWNDLSWQDVAPDGGSIQINQSFTLVEPSVNSAEAESKARHDQYNEDKNVLWNSETNAADLAYVLYQVPVLVAIHASEMLPKP